MTAVTIDVLRAEDGNQEHTHQLKRMRFRLRASLLQVCITTSWALTNICDSLHHCIDAVASKRCSVDLKVAWPPI
ncbi:hypothetical protein ACSBR1_036947 [Camellia fascicularis]